MQNAWTLGKLNDIQWLRAAAALEVAVWHSDLATKTFSQFSVHALDWYRPLGGIGVELFFIVSGFVMCLRLPSYRTGAQFMYARIARLAPMYWLFTSLVIAVYLLNPAWRLNAFELDFSSILKSYLMLPQRHYPILGVGWSLEIEMIFYAELALAMIVAAALLRHPGNSIVYVLVIAGIAGFVFGTGPVPRFWDYHLLSPYMLLFAFGWAMCATTRSKTRSAEIKTLVAAVLIWLVALVVSDSADRNLVFRMGIAAAVFTLARTFQFALQRDVAINHMASAIADASYSLYLSHWFVLSGLGKFLGTLQMPQTLDWTARVAGLVAAVLFALLCFRYVENPIDRRLRMRPRGRETSAAPFKSLTRLPSDYSVVPLDGGIAASNVAGPIQHGRENGKWR